MVRDDAWEAFSSRLFDQNRFAIKLGLDNIGRALEAESHPERNYPCIVVGGTNGKGTVASMIAAGLQAHGLRVGLYTSPHLIEVRERFRVNGVPLSRTAVLDAGRHALERYATSDSDPCLTFFEITTLIAALLFRDAAVDVAVFEVGLGGRLDAVNAIEPALTVLTTIGFDHQAYLGDSIEEIAAEKAALLRPKIAAVIGPQEYPAARTVLESFRGPLHVQLHEESESSYRHRHEETARCSVQRFLGARFDPDAFATGMKSHRWPGRLDTRLVEIGGKMVSVTFDAAHNADGMRLLARELCRLDVPPQSLVLGAMSDKLTPEFCAAIRALDLPVFLAKIRSERAASPAELRAALGEVVVEGEGAVQECLLQAASRCRHFAVAGSVYLLGEAFSEVGVTPAELVTFSTDTN